IFSHTYATNLYYVGIDIKSAQYLLGHSSLDMTLRIYTHLDSKRSNNMAREKIKNFFSQSNVILRGIFEVDLSKIAKKR
ncbi:MAG: tyrosine-type recombinase/integrase, partial [Firmicutes bacterium]|nr:tyrosine-type recombinase/integrase [Bacillota bacterium]